MLICPNHKDCIDNEEETCNHAIPHEFKIADHEDNGCIGAGTACPDCVSIDFIEEKEMII